MAGHSLPVTAPVTTRFRIPHTLVLLFLIMIAALVATWLLPQGSFSMEADEAGRMMVVPGTYAVHAERVWLSPAALFTSVPRALADADVAIINTNYALEAGLNPEKDAIAIEAAESPYANIIVVRSADKDAPWAKTLVDSYHSDAVKKYIQDKYTGAVIPAW